VILEKWVFKVEKTPGFLIINRIKFAQDSIMNSDQWPAYATLNDHGFVHNTVNHLEHLIGS